MTNLFRVLKDCLRKVKEYLTISLINSKPCENLHRIQEYLNIGLKIQYFKN